MVWLGLSMGAGTSFVLGACGAREPGVSLDPSLQMVDCSFRRLGNVHLHVSPQRRLASVLTAYLPKPDGNHADALQQARESKGRLLEPEPYQHRIELFLRNDQFGARDNEVLLLTIDKQGLAEFQAKLPGKAHRMLDSGRCVVGGLGH